MGADHELNQFQHFTEKDVKTAYQNHSDFFDKIINASREDDFEIYSYGFSFSDVDKFYLRKLCNDIDTTKVKFYLNDFDKNDLPRQMKVLKECGFKGEILTFNTTG